MLLTQALLAAVPTFDSAGVRFVCCAYPSSDDAWKVVWRELHLTQATSAPRHPRPPGPLSIPWSAYGRAPWWHSDPATPHDHGHAPLRRLRLRRPRLGGRLGAKRVHWRGASGNRLV